MASNHSEWICGRLLLWLTGWALASNDDGENDLPFNYVPSFDAGIVFVVLFSLVTGTVSSFSASNMVI